MRTASELYGMVAVICMAVALLSQDRVAVGDTGAAAENPFYPTNVVVHPLVLLSTVDHFHRVNPKGGKGRVVGVLLGEVWQGRVDVTNSFAVPFDEDDKSQGVWYLDHDYLEKMSRMFKKVAAKEKIVGWYSTGPKIKPIDIQINHLFRDWGQGAAKDPVFVIIDVNIKQDQLPSEAYVAVEEVSSEAATSEWTFKHLPSEIGAFEAEEIGVEHLLRDIKDTTISTLTQDVESKVSSLRSLLSHIELMAAYLRKVNTGELPINHTVRNSGSVLFVWPRNAPTPATTGIYQLCVCADRVPDAGHLQFAPQHEHRGPSQGICRPDERHDGRGLPLGAHPLRHRSAQSRQQQVRALSQLADTCKLLCFE